MDRFAEFLTLMVFGIVLVLFVSLAAGRGGPRPASAPAQALSLPWLRGALLAVVGTVLVLAVTGAGG